MAKVDVGEDTLVREQLENTDNCALRRAGSEDDGYCSATCGLCSREACGGKLKGEVGGGAVTECEMQCANGTSSLYDGVCKACLLGISAILSDEKLLSWWGALSADRLPRLRLSPSL